MINRKLGIGAPVALHIESVREGEEPIIFGPDAVLVNYGNGWNLQTVSEMDFPGTSLLISLKYYYDFECWDCVGSHSLTFLPVFPV